MNFLLEPEETTIALEFTQTEKLKDNRSRENIHYSLKHLNLIIWSPFLPGLPGLKTPKPLKTKRSPFLVPGDTQIFRCPKIVLTIDFNVGF